MTPIVLDAADVDDLPRHSLGGIPGTEQRVLWDDGTSSAGILTVAAGHHLGRHAHRQNHHHMWVLEGHAEIVDSEVGPGSYIHIPAGVHHDLDATLTEGCTIFYLYLRGAD